MSTIYFPSKIPPSFFLFQIQIVYINQTLYTKPRLPSKLRPRDIIHQTLPSSTIIWIDNYIHALKTITKKMSSFLFMGFRRPVHRQYYIQNSQNATYFENNIEWISWNVGNFLQYLFFKYLLNFNSLFIII